MDFISTYLDRFAGCPAVYAIRWEFTGKDDEKVVVYIPSTYDGSKETVHEFVNRTVSSIGEATFGEKAALAHMKGEHFLGVYPVHPDSTVKFFAVDYDGKDKEVSEIWLEAFRQQQIFEKEAGIPTYLEMSRSGKGFHLWGFLEEPVDAGLIRHALMPFIENPDIQTYDRMFPNQEGVTESRPYGNLIALPLAGPLVKEGKTAFYEPNGVGKAGFNKVADQRQFLVDTKKISKAKIQELADLRGTYEKSVSKISIRAGAADEGIPGLHKVIHPILGCEWIRWCYDNPTLITEEEWYAVACQFAQLEGGRKEFHEFSALDHRRYNASDCDNKFDHAIEANAPHGCQHIRDSLNRHGPPCTCDERYPGVFHPFDIAKLPFHQLLNDYPIEGDLSEGPEGLREALEWTKQLFRNGGNTGANKYYIDIIDEVTEMRAGDLIIVGGRPGRGKTAFALDVALRNAMHGVPCYFFSMEMSARQLWKRVLSNMAEVNATRMLKGELVKSEWLRLHRAIQKAEKGGLPFYVDDMAHETSAVIDRAADLIYKHGKGIIFVDYLQMAANLPNENLYEKNSRVPREYKRMAKALEVPAFVLAQLNRSADDTNEDSETFDSMLEGSGKIEQYADVIMFLFGQIKAGIVPRTLILHKERHREAGHRLDLDFNQPLMRFEGAGTFARKAPSSGPVSNTVSPTKQSMTQEAITKTFGDDLDWE